MRPYETPEIKQKLDYVTDCVLRVVPETESIILFGSYAYGEPHKDSDLDIYVIVPDKVEERDLDLEIGISREIGKDYDKLMFPLDLLVAKSSLFHDRRTRPTISRTVANKGVVIYEPSRPEVV